MDSVLTFRSGAIRNPYHPHRAGLLPQIIAGTRVDHLAKLSIDDYADRTAKTIPAWKSMRGQQSGDPVKLAKALLTIASENEPPLRWIAGAGAIAAVEQKIAELQKQIDAYRDLSLLSPTSKQPGA